MHDSLRFNCGLAQQTCDLGNNVQLLLADAVRELGGTLHAAGQSGMILSWLRRRHGAQHADQEAPLRVALEGTARHCFSAVERNCVGKLRQRPIAQPQKGSLFHDAIDWAADQLRRVPETEQAAGSRIDPTNDEITIDRKNPVGKEIQNPVIIRISDIQGVPSCLAELEAQPGRKR